MSLSDERPLTGIDLRNITDEWGLTNQEVQFLLGIPQAAWNKINQDLNEPIYDIAISILIRFYQNNPEKLPLKLFKTSTHNYIEKLKELRPDTWKNELGSLVGRDNHTAFYRWISYKKNLSPASERIAALLTSEKDDPEAILVQLEKASEIENQFKK